jgi:hypothetical protein
MVPVPVRNNTSIPNIGLFENKLLFLPYFTILSVKYTTIEKDKYECEIMKLYGQNYPQWLELAFCTVVPLH